MTTPAIPHLLACGSYHPGHAVHWIQAKRSHDPPHRAGIFVVDHCILRSRREGTAVEPRSGSARSPARRDRRARHPTLSRRALALQSKDGHYCISVASEPSLGTPSAT